MTSTAYRLCLDAALLFGVSTPAAKLSLAGTDPWMLASLLYLGSGTGLGTFVPARRAVGLLGTEASLGRREAIELIPSAHRHWARLRMGRSGPTGALVPATTDVWARLAIVKLLVSNYS
jgi:hypothetical protein